MRIITRTIAYLLTPTAVALYFLLHLWSAVPQSIVSKQGISEVQNQIEATESYIERLLNNIIDGLPEFIGAVVILIVSYFVARLLRNATTTLLSRAKLNQRLHSGSGGNMFQRAIPDPSHLIAQIVFWVVFLFGLSLAISVLGVPLLNDFLRSIYSYLPNVLAALLIFLAAGAISTAIVSLVHNIMGQTTTGNILATAAPIIVMSIAIFMILNQLKIAPEIVTITYAAIVGSAALGMALAFGLGGREVAASILKNLYDKGRANSSTVKQDLEQARTAAKQKSEQIRNS